MLEKKAAKYLLYLVLALSFLVSNVKAADVLFIMSFDDTYMEGDELLIAYIESLGHNVILFDDDESEEDTEIAAAEADVVFISESVSSQRIRLEIPEVEVPIVTNEAWALDEMGMTLGTGEGIEVATKEIQIVNPDHYLAAGFSGTVEVISALATSRGAARFATGRVGDEGTVIATATLSDGVTYDVEFIYEKGAALPVAPADGSDQVAADMRICVGFDEQSYLAWNDNAFTLLGTAIEYALGMSPTASNPRPKEGEIEVPRDAVLQWAPGGFADKHNVYFGTVAEDVDQATVDDPKGVLVAQDLEENLFDPDGLLDYGVTYYWRVDELSDTNADSPWKGDVWSFEVVNYLVVVDDFEDYNDFSPDEIWNTWIDGYGDATNGSTAGYPDPDFIAGEHFVETNIVRNGEQSMPLFYNNVAGLSEVTRAINDDWTVGGVVSLGLFYLGAADNVAEPMYVALNGNAVVENDDINAALATEWTRFDAPLQAFADQGVNLSNVSSLSIGLGNKDNPVAGGGEGVLYIDDIRLYLPWPGAN